MSVRHCEPGDSPSLDPLVLGAAIIASALDAVIVVDAHSVVRLVNPAAERLFGYPAQAVVGQSLDMLIPERFRQQHYSSFGTATVGSVRIRRTAGLGLIMGLRADGTEFPLEATVSELAVEGRRLFAAICRDATPYVAAEAAEEQRRQAQEETARIAAAVPGIVYTCRARPDGSLFFPFVTPRIELLCGVPASTLAADARPALACVHDDDLAGVLASIAQAVESSAPWSYEFRINSPALGLRWIEGSSTPVREADGGVLWTGYLRDITDRMAVEHALRDSEETFRSYFQRAPTPIFVADDGGRYLDMNRAAEELLGYESGELFGRTIPELLPRASLEEGRRHFAQVVHSGSAVGEIDLRRKDGTTVKVIIHATRLAPDRLLAFCENVTARSRLESLLRVRLQLSELAQTGSLDDVMQTALDAAEALTDSRIGFFHFVDADQEHLLLQAWSTNTVAHMCTADGKGQHYPISEAGVWVDCFRQRRPVVHNDYASLPHRKGMPEGHAPVQRELVVPVVRADQVTAIIGVGNKPTDYSPEDVAALEELASIASDIVARKRAESEVQHFVAGSPSVIYALRTDAAGQPRVSWISENVLRLTGFSVHEARQAGWWRSQVHAEDRQRVEAFDGRRDGDLHSIVFRFRRKDGHDIWMRDDRRVLPSVPGHPAEIIGAWSDVTEVRHLEDQLRQAQKLEAVGQLAGGVAHDFNNLLTVITGYSEVLLTLVHAGDPAREYVADIHEAGERATALTRQLLAFSRKQVLEPQVLDIDDVLGRIEKLLRRLIGEHIALIVNSRPGLGFIRVDPGQLEQVIVNLAVNARDAMPRGGRLTFETRVVDVDADASERVPGTRPGAYVCLAVSDTGIGMSAEVKARVFEPFFTTKEAGHGTGLGLATVFGIVTQSDGAIDLESEVGIGTTFRIWFPVVRPPSQGPALPPSAEPSRGHETILLVEDDEAVRRIAKLALEVAGYAVLPASGGEAALDTVRTHDGPIDLLLTDVVMPGMDGGEVADAVTALRPGLPVLFMSGYVDNPALRARISSGGASLLQKPFNPQTLLQRVRDLLDRRRG